MASIQQTMLKQRLDEARRGVALRASEAKPAPKPRRGEDIFATAGGPRTWADYIGQRRAKGQLRAAVASAKFRSERVDHILIASGVPGVGKSALARLVAYEYGGGLVETQGAVSQDEAKAILGGMEDGDFWLIDEVHQLVVGGKSKAEWLLPLLMDGVLLTPQGEWKAPKVTVIAASTNAAELPEAILSRFTLKPVIDAYGDDEAATIAAGMAQAIFAPIGLSVPSEGTCAAVAAAANNSPRDIQNMLRLLRDAEIAGMAERDENGDSDLTEMLEWAGRTADGLDDLAQRYLAVMYTTFGGRTGKANIASVLGESTYPHLTEQVLLTKGYLGIDKGGRYLTEMGQARTMGLWRD